VGSALTLSLAASLALILLHRVDGGEGTAGLD